MIQVRNGVFETNSSDYLVEVSKDVEKGGE